MYISGVGTKKMLGGQCPPSPPRSYAPGLGLDVGMKEDRCGAEEELRGGRDTAAAAAGRN